MRRIFPLFLIVLGLGLAFGAGRVLAGLSFGTGSYVNLCGSGTSATKYSCDTGCDPTKGSCTSATKGAVKYICSGRWDQCLDAEGYFSNSESIGSVACGNTVQLSLYDKMCRKEDGGWDSSCKLLGYMVWYSGDCWDGTTPITPLPTKPLSVSPTIRLGATPTIIPTPTSRLAVVESTPSGTLKACNRTCGTGAACGAGFSCIEGACRNPSCPSDKSCFCGKPQQTPDTGGEMWALLAIAGFVGGGILVRKTARWLW